MYEKVKEQCGPLAWYSGDANPVDYSGVIYLPGDDREIDLAADDEPGDYVWHGWHYATAVRIEPLQNACGEPGCLISRITINLPQPDAFRDPGGWRSLDECLRALQCAGPDIEDFCSDEVSERDRWMMLAEACVGYGLYEADHDPYSGGGSTLLISETEASEANDPIKVGDNWGFGRVDAIVPDDDYDEAVLEAAFDLCPDIAYVASDLEVAS